MPARQGQLDCACGLSYFKSLEIPKLGSGVMALIPIIYIPDPVLRQVAVPVTEITDGTRQLLDDMAETMYDAPGIGLAAPQVNVSQRVIVMDCGPDDAPELRRLSTTPKPRPSSRKAVFRSRNRLPMSSVRQASMCAIWMLTARSR